MTVDPTTAPASVTTAEGTWHFCSTRCRDAFVADPGRYGHAQHHELTA